MTPFYKGKPRTQLAVLATVAGGKVDLIAGVAAKSILKFIKFQASGTTLAGRIKVFIFDNTNNRQIGTVLVEAITPSNTVKEWEHFFKVPDDLTLENANWKFKAELAGNDNPIDVTTVVGDLG